MPNDQRITHRASVICLGLPLASAPAALANETPDGPIRAAAGRVILALSGTGFPLTQLAIRRFGWRGALLVEGVTTGLLVRDALLLAAGTPGRLQPGPARLLWAETAVAAAATGAGLVLLRDADVTAARQQGWRVPRRELVRRIAVGALFGLHTMRFRIYLAPGSGRRQASGAG